MSTRRGPAAASAAPPRVSEGNGDGAPARPASKSVKLFVNHGERSGITEEDLRWALREGAVLPEEAIHEVRVLHRFSFVEVASRPGGAGGRVPRRDEAQRQGAAPRAGEGLTELTSVNSAIRANSSSKSIGLVTKPSIASPSCDAASISP